MKDFVIPTSKFSKAGFAAGLKKVADKIDAVPTITDLVSELKEINNVY